LTRNNLAEKLSFIRKAVDFLLGYTREYKGKIEVFVNLQSNGGTVQSYGLLAEQLRRLRAQSGITLTIACDLQALSGGYLIASVASPGHMLASPFAAVGSIGVISGPLLDFEEALSSYGIKQVQVKSGDHKPSGGLLSGVSDRELQQIQERNDRTHTIFKDYVVEQRRDKLTADHDLVFSGDFWLGKDAKGLGLVDELSTSDEYLGAKALAGGIVLNLRPHGKQEQDEDKGLFLSCLDLLISLLGWIVPPEDGAKAQAHLTAGQDIAGRIAGLL